MNTYRKRILLFFVLLTGFAIEQVQGQEISGDTIYVNAEAEIMVRFPSMPTFFNTIPSDAPYNFKTAGTGFTIISKTEKTKPAPLMVTEGGRNHKFLLVFKKNIDYNNDAEMDYDYSSTKKLEQHIRDVAAGRIPENKTAELAEKDDKKSKKSKKDKSDDNSAAGYYALLEEGDNNIRQKDFKAAKLNFEKAASIRPNDQIPKQRLEEVRIRLADQEKTAAQEINKQYVDVIATAKSNLNAKKYDKAQEAFKKALELKPGDIYAKHQLEKIDGLINSDNDKKEQKKLDDLYKGYISTGEKALKKNDLADARVAYEQALIIKQNDPVALSKLKVISDTEKKDREKADQETTYNSTIENADKLFKAGYFAEAKTEYNRALGFSKKTYPQDQIKTIDKLLIAEVAKEKESKLKNQKQKDVETEYNETIKAADKFFAAKDYTNATIAYNKALKIEKKPWPAEQLKAIQKITDQEEADKKAIAKKETDKQAKERKKQEEKENDAREKEYKTLMKEADKLFKKKDYDAAKAEYVKASALTNEKKPFEQIVAINKILDEEKAKVNAEKLRLEKENEINTQYTSAMAKADKEFDKGDYLKARKLYADAALIKPSEKLPKEKINQIETRLAEIAAAEKAKKDSIAAAKELEKKFVLAMSKAKSYLLKEDLVNAKDNYAEAARLKPREDEPQKQLNAIQTKLEAIAKAAEVDNKYDQKVVTADSLMILKSYETAITAYREALIIKPNQYYPLTQINYLSAEIRNQQKDKEDRAKLEAYQKEADQEQKYLAALKKGKQAVADKKYEEAKAAYTEVLSFRPDHEYALHMLTVIDFQMSKENIAKNKKNEDTKQTANEKKDKVNKTTDKPKAEPVAIPVTPIPYTPAELKTKYPDIDFANLPPEQPFNAEAVNTTENATMFRDMLAESPRLNLTDSKDKIKLTCQAINFEGSNTYVKFMVENNSKTDFLTGAMMLTWTKRSGNKIKLYPVYLFPAFLPIVTPGNQAVVIYVCKSYFINDNEKLNFEMSDRLNKIKLEIDISAKKYNEEEARY